MSTARIFLVEDVQSHREALSANLLEEGFKIYSAKDKLEAMEVLNNVTPHVALVDLGLEGNERPDDLSGQEIIAKIKKLNECTRIIVVTKHTDARTMRKMTKELGADDYVTKRDIGILGTSHILDAIKTELNQCELDDPVASIFDVTAEVFFPQGENLLVSQIQATLKADVPSIHRALLRSFNSAKPVCLPKRNPGMRASGDKSKFSTYIWSKSFGEAVEIVVQSSTSQTHPNALWARDFGKISVSIVSSDEPRGEFLDESVICLK
ncbi:response regulator transcription factor [Primorskyibacter sp. 2E233]|uniref:response regulator transcription factor n=1 Tax=Primorskyibacter sp. 2E233 TaxID=3413431 RepID=UPI003BF25B69